MKIYRNDRHGFEIEIPMDWFLVVNPHPSLSFGETLLFYCGQEEAFNIIVGILVPEWELPFTENHFHKYAEEKGYSVIQVANINVFGKDHFCASYIQYNNVWTKKYMIVFNETEYDITASCFTNEAFIKNEKKWDDIVKTFKIFPHEKPIPMSVEENITQAGLYFEYGNRLFNEGKYEQAIVQFEKGKALGDILPGNYLGVAATIMQMIEKNQIPKEEMLIQLKKAELNIEECIRILPNDQEYRKLEKMIKEKKQKLL
jgi:tetratricopeptide (TPR) repeat protein